VLALASNAEGGLREAAPVLVVTGSVLDTSGDPLEGAEILVGDPWEGESSVARSDASGAFRGELVERPDSFLFTAFAEGFEGARKHAEGPRGAELRLGTFRLGPGGEVGGRVVDERGQGIVRAWVEWLPATAFPVDFDAAREDGPEEEDYDERRFHALARTGADGAFRLRGLPRGECFLAAHAHAKQHGWTGIFEVRGGPLPELEIVLLPSVTARSSIAGIVEDPAGQPLADIALRFRMRDQRMDLATTGPDGRFVLDYGWTRPVDLGAHDPKQRYGSTWIEGVRPGTQDLVLRMGEPSWIVLRLVDAVGRAVPWGHVRLEGVQHDGGREGSVRIERPDEPFRVEVSAPGFRPETLGPLEPPPPGAELRLTLQPGQSLRGRVVHRGRPVAGARLDLARTHAPGETREGRGFAPSDHPFLLVGSVDLDGNDGTSDGSGAFVLTIHEDGWQGLRVEAQGFPMTVFGPYDLERTGGEAELVLELERAGSIEGSVRSAPGGEARERLVAASNGWSFVRTAPVDSDGRYRLEDLAPGPYQVRSCEPPAASLQPFQRWSSSAGPVAWDCRVQSGSTTRFDLDLAGEGTVVLSGRLQLVGAEARAAQALLFAPGTQPGSWSPPRASSEVASDGSFELVLSRPGSYRLEVQAPPLTLSEELELFAGRREWTQRLETGRLRIRPGADQGSVRYTARAGPLEILASIRWFERGEPVSEVPAGRGRLERRAPANPPQPWALLREVEVPAGQEVVVEVP
jgi:hypothetical protein